MIVKSFVLREETFRRIAGLCPDGTVAVIRPEKKLENLFKAAVHRTILEKQPADAEFQAIRAYFEALSAEPAFLAKVDAALHNVSAYLGEGMYVQATLRSVEDYVMVKCARLCAEAVNMTLNAPLIDGTELMICRQQGEKTVVDWNLSREQIRERCKVNAKTLIPGGYGRLESGYVVRIGRGGAHVMAALIASALQAERIECYVEEDGIQGIPSMSYDEAAHYCASKAAPFPSASLWPAKKAGIPILVLNILRPAFPGTCISASSSHAEGTVSGVISDTDLSLITVYGTGLLGQVGMSSAIFSAMAQAGVNVRFISQSSSEYSISFAVRQEDRQAAEDAVSALVQSEDDVLIVSREVGIVTVYGDKMKNVPGVSAKVYAALAAAGVNTIAAAQGGEELSISIAVDAGRLDDAVKALAAIA